MRQNLIHKINANGKSYEIKEVHPIYPDSNEQDFLKLKIMRGHDALIKNDKFYFLCNEILEAEFVDIPNEPVNEPVSDTANEPVNKNNESN